MTHLYSFFVQPSKLKQVNKVKFSINLKLFDFLSLKGRKFSVMIRSTQKLLEVFEGLSIQNNLTEVNILRWGILNVPVFDIPISQF